MPKTLGSGWCARMTRGRNATVSGGDVAVAVGLITVAVGVTVAEVDGVALGLAVAEVSVTVIVLVGVGEDVSVGVGAVGVAVNVGGSGVTEISGVAVAEEIGFSVGVGETVVVALATVCSGVAETGFVPVGGVA
jgi:hypothetical protein